MMASDRFFDNFSLFCFRYTYDLNLCSLNSPSPVSRQFFAVKQRMQAFDNTNDFFTSLLRCSILTFPLQTSPTCLPYTKPQRSSIFSQAKGKTYDFEHFISYLDGTHKDWSLLRYEIFLVQVVILSLEFLDNLLLNSFQPRSHTFSSSLCNEKYLDFCLELILSISLIDFLIFLIEISSSSRLTSLLSWRDLFTRDIGLTSTELQFAGMFRVDVGIGVVLGEGLLRLFR